MNNKETYQDRYIIPSKRQPKYSVLIVRMANDCISRSGNIDWFNNIQNKRSKDWKISNKDLGFEAYFLSQLRIASAAKDGWS